MKFLPSLQWRRRNMPAALRVARDLLVVRYEPKVLPAALPYLSPIDELCETPPPRIMWSAHYIILAMFITLLVVASVAKIDVVVVGGGTVTTQTPPILLQPMDRGIVRELKVSAGDVVRKGQVLAVLDPTFSHADLATVEGQARGVKAQIRRLEAELGGRPLAAFAGATPDDIIQASLYRDRMDQYSSRLRVFDEDIKRLTANLHTTEDDRLSFSKQLDYAKEQEAMRSSLYQSQNGSKLSYLDAQTTLVRTQRDYQDAVNRLIEQQHSLQSKQAERQNFIDEWRRQANESLAAATTEEDKLREATAKATLVNNLVVVTAPADGVVLDVAKRSVGSIVNPAEPLVTIVPNDVPLVADIQIASTDVGYIKQGDEVVVKVQAFPYQRHGWLKGRLLYISEESYSSGGGTESGGGGAVHRGRVQLDSTLLENMPDGARLIPGMTVSAEILVGRRSVLAFFVSPLTRGLHESLREP